MKNIEHNNARFWNDLYLRNESGWDLAGPTQPFMDIIKSIDLQGKKYVFQDVVMDMMFYILHKKDMMLLLLILLKNQLQD